MSYNETVKSSTSLSRAKENERQYVSFRSSTCDIKYDVVGAFSAEFRVINTDWSEIKCYVL